MTIHFSKNEQILFREVFLVRVIGDASKVSTITNAVYWGYHAALDI